MLARFWRIAVGSSERVKHKQPRYEDGRVDRFTSKHGTHSNSQAQHRSHHQREGAVIIRSRDRFDCAANGIIVFFRSLKYECTFVRRNLVQRCLWISYSNKPKKREERMSAYTRIQRTRSASTTINVDKCLAKSYITRAERKLWKSEATNNN